MESSVFEQLKSGLFDSIAHSRGRLSLKTTQLPPPPPPVGPRGVTGLRRRLNMSQAVFAAVLNVSARTVQSWEQGARQPSDVALRMLQILRQRPELITSEVFGNGHRQTSRRTGRQTSGAPRTSAGVFANGDMPTRPADALPGSGRLNNLNVLLRAGFRRSGV